MKKLFYFSVAILISIILVWFGSKFLFWPEDTLSSLELYLFGALLLVGGIGFLSQPDFHKYWWLGALIILAGVYMFGRASGAIEQPWLARVLGSASWAASAILLYITWPGHSVHIKKASDEEVKAH